MHIFILKNTEKCLKNMKLIVIYQKKNYNLQLISYTKTNFFTVLIQKANLIISSINMFNTSIYKVKHTEIM